jgi:hypothetical protein
MTRNRRRQTYRLRSNACTPRRDERCIKQPGNSRRDSCKRFFQFPANETKIQFRADRSFEERGLTETEQQRG